MREACLVLDKTPGPTSFDVVREVKRTLLHAKVGHTGSLDPFASGVLVLLVGKATKLSNALLTADKSYKATVKLGESTDSMDRTGKPVESKPIPPLTIEGLRKVIKDYEGEWMQTPPMFSAKKLNGVRLYELARQNISVRRESTPVQLYRMELVGYEAPFLQFEVHCSKGTYIRSLADDLGRRLGTVAHLHELRRLSCGPFTLEESVEVESFKKDVDRQMEQGYRNFVRLLRTEGVLRSAVPGTRRLPLSLGSDSSWVN